MDQKFDFGGLGPDFEESEFWRIFEAWKIKQKSEKNGNLELEGSRDRYFGGGPAECAGPAGDLGLCKDLRFLFGTPVPPGREAADWNAPRALRQASTWMMWKVGYLKRQAGNLINRNVSAWTTRLLKTKPKLLHLRARSKMIRISSWSKSVRERRSQIIESLSQSNPKATRNRLNMIQYLNDWMRWIRSKNVLRICEKKHATIHPKFV